MTVKSTKLCPHAGCDPTPGIWKSLYILSPLGEAGRPPWVGSDPRGNCGQTSLAKDPFSFQ